MFRRISNTVRPRTNADNASIISSVAPSYRSFDPAAPNRDEDEISETSSLAPSYFSGPPQTYPRHAVQAENTNTPMGAESSSVIYFYYELYQAHTRIPSTTNPDDPFVGRINMRDLGPPRSAASIIMSIFVREKIDRSIKAAIFLRADDSSPVTDETMKILKIEGNPGGSVDTAIAIVLAKNSINVQQRTSSRQAPTPLTVRSSVVYYELFEEHVRKPSNASLPSHDVFIGLIDVRQLAPPRTISIVKEHIAALESIGSNDIQEIFSDVDEDEPANDELKVTGAPGGPGSSLESPLAVSIFKHPTIRPRRPSIITLAQFQTTTADALRDPSSRDKVLTYVKPLNWKDGEIRDNFDLYSSLNKTKGRVTARWEDIIVGEAVYVNPNNLVASENLIEIIVCKSRKIGYHKSGAVTIID